ncbi:hypothetical protein B0A62_09730 [Flavobacterium hydatis]|uniref:Uncharacterized protein n=1 Tax=Flavobacterium hydatis TaxID=991 RepID=A0A086AKX2_FLAHY|nr:hypothetical protein IW20_08315 [Flavobacterium hydatis]OXA95169.1 hypothetical protein B0A62_09730 [Flavobacterium hydatis]
MSIYKKIGIGFIINGIIMFLITGALFSYMGTLNPLIKLIGEISFICWVPSIILGIFMIQIKNNTSSH